MCKLPTFSKPAPVRADGGSEDNTDASIEFVVTNTFITPVTMKSDKVALRRVKSEPSLLASKPIHKVSMRKLSGDAPGTQASKLKDEAKKMEEAAQLMRQAAKLKVQYEEAEDAARRVRQAAQAAKLRAQAREAEEAAQQSRQAAKLWKQAREAEEAAQRSRQAAKLWAQAQEVEKEVERAAQRVRRSQEALKAEKLSLSC